MYSYSHVSRIVDFFLADEFQEDSGCIISDEELNRALKSMPAEETVVITYADCAQHEIS
jgi:hypothetical protein